MAKYTGLALVIVTAGMLFASPLYAQFFSSNPVANNQRPAAESANEVAPVAGNQPQQYAQPTRTGQNPALSPFDYGKQEFTEDVRNRTAPGRVISFGPETEKKDQELIMMYMKDFNIYRSPSGQTRCSAQFAIVTTLPTRLSNISYRLQWPEMNTVLSFSNVMPEVENHYNYSLLGDGCYSMDKTPNIVINRCRVKGMSQQECASKIRWITRR